MEADIRWLDDPQVFRVGQLPAHSDHPIYGDVEEAAEGKSSLVQSLDGNWEFAYSVNAASRPVDFYRDNAGDTEFETIRVPGHIELSGYDKSSLYQHHVSLGGQNLPPPGLHAGKRIGRRCFQRGRV